jgi:poly(ADP-ribose) glycohydrolase
MLTLQKIIAIDALMNIISGGQWKMKSMLREITKAYTGFSVPYDVICGDSDEKNNYGSSIATGNWGCGAFGGNAKLKFVLQWVASSLAERSLVYCTFGSQDMKSVEQVIAGAVKKDFRVSHVIEILEKHSSGSNLESGDANSLWSHFTSDIE